MTNKPNEGQKVTGEVEEYKKLQWQMNRHCNFHPDHRQTLGYCFHNSSHVETLALSFGAKMAALLDRIFALPPKPVQDDALYQCFEALEIVLPMAKGYAAAHRVGSNAQKITLADTALTAAREQMKEGL